MGVLLDTGITSRFRPRRPDRRRLRGEDDGGLGENGGIPNESLSDILPVNPSSVPAVPAPVDDLDERGLTPNPLPVVRRNDERGTEDIEYPQTGFWSPKAQGERIAARIQPILGAETPSMDGIGSGRPVSPAMAASQPETDIETPPPPGKPKTYPPGKDPRKTRRENLRDEIEARTTQPIEQKRGFVNSLKGLGIGFLQAFARSDPRESFSNRLMEAMGGAGAGLATSIVDPSLLAKARNQQKLQELYGQYGQQAKMDEADAKIRDEQAKAEGTRYDNINKRAGDFLKVAMADNNIDKDEAATLRTLTGLPYNPGDWRKVIRMNENGVPFISREGEEASRIDTTLPILPSEVPKTRTIPGQGTFTVPDKSAFPVAGSVAVGNANRQDAASRFETTQKTQEAEKEFANEKDYQSAVQSHEQRVRKGKADLAKAQKIATALATQLEAAQAEKSANAGYDTTEIDKRISDIMSRQATAEGDIESAKILMDEPLPKKTIRPKNPKTSLGGKNENIGSPDAYAKARDRIKAAAAK